MHYAIPLALAGSLCTAMSSVCQRLGAKNAEATRVDLWLIVRLARRPVWLVGLASQSPRFAPRATARLRLGGGPRLGPGPPARLARRRRHDGRSRPAPAGRLAVGRA